VLRALRENAPGGVTEAALAVVPIRREGEVDTSVPMRSPRLPLVAVSTAYSNLPASMGSLRLRSCWPDPEGPTLPAGLVL
jgi:hypothetical protein